MESSGAPISLRETTHETSADPRGLRALSFAHACGGTDERPRKRGVWLLLRRHYWLKCGLIGFLLLCVPAISNAAELKQETIKGWDDYIRTTKLRFQEHLRAGGDFLLSDEVPDKAARVQRGEIVVSPVGKRSPINVPHGLIHDWIGTVFIPHATAHAVIAMLKAVLLAMVLGVALSPAVPTLRNV
jgi:hypothetical protein